MLFVPIRFNNIGGVRTRAMDFKDVLAQEILAKKTRLEEAKAVTGKYARRGDVEHIGVREGTSDGTGQVQGRDDEEPDVRVDEQEASKKRSRLHTDESVLSERLEDDEEVLPSALNDNIERLLKSRSQPIRLFGETDRQRSDRLKVLMTKDFLEDDKIVSRRYIPILSYSL